MSALPAPLVPAEVDLNDFKFIPLHIARLHKSKAWLACKRRPELAFYLLNLWMRAWHERPAGSIEDDDDVLADAAGCDPQQWPALKADVLRGWELCADGRYYNRTVAQLALDAWQDRIEYRARMERMRQAKQQKRPGLVGESASDAPVFKGPLQALKGEGQGENKGEGDFAAAPRVDQGDPGRESERRIAIGNKVLAAAGIDPARWVGSFALISGWLNAGFDPDLDIIPAVQAVAKRPGYTPDNKPFSYFTRAIERAWQDRTRDVRSGPRPAAAARAGQGAAAAPPGIHSADAEKFLAEVAARARARQRAVTTADHAAPDEQSPRGELK